jgi:hypothetical protein
MPAGLTDGLGWIRHLVFIMDDRATSQKMAYRRDLGTARPTSAEDAVAAVEQRRSDALIVSDINVWNEIIDEPCRHGASHGTARTKAVCLEQVATWEGSFDRFEIDENHLRTFGEAAVVAGIYRDIVRLRGKLTPPEARAAPARVWRPWRKLEARGASGYGDRARVNLRHAPIFRAWAPESVKKLAKPLCRTGCFGSRGILGSSLHDSRVL